VVTPSDQPKVCLVTQGGGLIIVDERQKVGGSRSVASRRSIKEARHLGHSAEYHGSGQQRNEKSGDQDVALSNIGLMKHVTSPFLLHSIIA